jgi:hypothetical protein
MRAIRTAKTNGELKLGGAGPEHNLPIQHGPSAGAARLVERGDPCYHLPYVASVWEPTHEERAHIAIGRNLELILLTAAPVPPLAIGVTDEDPLDTPTEAAQPSIDEPAVWAALPLELARDVAEVLGYLEAQRDAARDMETELAPGLDERIDRLGALRERLAAYVDELDRLVAEGQEPTP